MKNNNGPHNGDLKILNSSPNLNCDASQNSGGDESDDSHGSVKG